MGGTDRTIDIEKSKKKKDVNEDIGGKERGVKKKKRCDLDNDDNDDDDHHHHHHHHHYLT